METLSSTILPSGLAETCSPRQFPVSSFFKVSPFRRGILRTQENPYALRLSVCQSDALRCSPSLRALAGDVSGNSEGGDEVLGRGSGFLPAEGFPLIERDLGLGGSHETGVSENPDMVRPVAGGSGSSGSRSGLFRTPISGGVQTATSTHDLPSPALAVRNLMEQIPGWSGLSNARVTIFGDIVPLPADQQEWARQQYMAKHQQWSSHQWGNFYYYRMQSISDIYFIGGFGTVAWVNVNEYEATQPDKIAADGGEQSLKELNANFSKPLKELLSMEAEIDDAALISIDSKGIDIRVRQGAQFNIQRLSFEVEHSIETLEEAKKALQKIIKGYKSNRGMAKSLFIAFQIDKRLPRFHRVTAQNDCYGFRIFSITIFMADVIDMPTETLDRGLDIQPQRQESHGGGSPSSPPRPPKRRDRDMTEKRDEYRARSPSLPPPPPLGQPRDDRDREYRRRGSRSPLPYRDRRHSPPRRSPPPGSFKRARRDDGGYERRRGSPRGGYGPDGRRYGYDYGGGYDRGGSGSRGGYGDERPHGRYMNHPSGYDGYGDGSEVIQRGGLMTYKQFIQELEDDISPTEAEHRYEEYRSEYISTQKRAYFEAHKEKQWYMKVKMQKRRLLDGRLRDERGNRRETNRNDGDDDRHDRTDNSPRDANDGSEVENHGKPLYDAYGGQGLHGAFPSDIPPPPVLMPVPGAGPLGPFVPAPPEVAMRMLRDTSGPSSFEATGGRRGIKGRLGPQVSGSAPVLAMPPPFQHDPRRIRSYQDLDAPEDEVTVIDYRSL
ncbi:Pyridoxamine 5'-phosphate oxidase [Musa troglodytarum]|uniref:Pyridoxamine 5'-phosphate oxidase n=1 Tax=Musa troglodytarum TaxID=320322 RepID=A0A9E7KH74_9LILI|nr:Pyridoxamine 5'-phosphate oxidase [Musa troglodytarum]